MSCSDIQVFKLTNYDMFLFTGPFRLLRVRRVLKALDDVRASRADARPTVPLFCGITLSLRAVGFVLLAVRIVLFVLCSTAIILVFEFPCSMYVMRNFVRWWPPFPTGTLPFSVFGCLVVTRLGP